MHFYEVYEKKAPSRTEVSIHVGIIRRVLTAGYLFVGTQYIQTVTT